MHAERPAFGLGNLRRQTFGIKSSGLIASERSHTRSGHQCIGLVIVRLEAEPRGRAPEALKRAIEVCAAS